MIRSRLTAEHRKLLLLAAPALLLLLLALWPLISGERTLFLRDLFNVHLAMKAEQARALLGTDGSDSALALVGPGIAGGQPLLGNPNSVPLYPTNVLYLFTPLFWALNAHLWLHVLLAPWSFYWLARVWGLRREAAWAAGVAYGFSGYLISQLNFTNLVAVASLTPALIAAVLRVTEPAPSTASASPESPAQPRGRYALVSGLLWALLLLGGEPLLAVLALGLAVTAVLAREGRTVVTPGFWREHLRGGDWRARSLPLVLALAAGSLVALPQIVETLRILPISYRGHQGYSETTRTATSLHPAQALEWLLPSAFGRMDLLRYGSFWGGRFFNEMPPFYFSLYPGLLVFALIGASGGRRPKHTASTTVSNGHSNGHSDGYSDGHGPLRLWAWTLIAVGLFFALGRHNPVADFLLGLPGLQVLRYPIKLMLPVVLGASLLAGLGFQRCWLSVEGSGPSPGMPSPGMPALRRTLAVLLAVFVGAWVLLDQLPQQAFALLRDWVPAGFPHDFVLNEVERWQALCVLSLGLLLLYFALTVLAARTRLQPRVALLSAALLLGLHAGSQLFFLQPAMPTDEVAAYTQAVPLLGVVPPGARVLHGSEDGAFEQAHVPGVYPEPTAAWQQRRVFHELYSAAGILNGRRYELNLSPEGLSSFLARAAHDLMPQLDDTQRLRLLEAWGVERLILNRPLDASASQRAELVSHQRRFDVDVFVYALPATTPQVFHAGTMLPAPHLNAAVEHLLSADFDPRTAVVVPGGLLSSPAATGISGSVRILSQGREHLEVEVVVPENPGGPGDSDGESDGGALVWQRAHLPLYRATVDGEPATVRVANLYRIAVETPPGRHVVRIETERRPLQLSLIGSLIGLLSLLLLWRWPSVGRTA